MKEIGALTGLRAVAALWVFVFHLNDLLFRVDREAAIALRYIGMGGYLGVDIFFVLSGFVLAYNYADKDLIGSRHRYGRFLWKRLARIYPVHIAALLIVAALCWLYSLAGSTFLSPQRLSMTGLLQSLTLTHGLAIPIDKTWNTVSWSISCEWAAYICLPVIAAFSNRLRSPALIVAVIVALYAALAAVLYNGTYASSIAYGLPRIAAEFSSGVLLHRLWVLRGMPQSQRSDTLALICLLLLIAITNAVGFSFRWYSGGTFTPILAAALVYFLACASGPFSRFLSQPASIYLGRVSYSFYMVHLLMLQVAVTATKSAVGVAVLAITISLAMSAALFRYIESPARRAMVAMLKPRSESVATTLPARLDSCVD